MRIERDGHVLEAEVDMVEVTTMGPEYRPDPAWLYVDSEGHEHRWVDGAVPTCERLYEEWIDADGDDRSDSWYECVICRADVQPGYQVVPGTDGGFRRFMPGAARYYIDGVPVTEVEAREFAGRA